MVAFLEIIKCSMPFILVIAPIFLALFNNINLDTITFNGLIHLHAKTNRNINGISSRLETPLSSSSDALLWVVPQNTDI